MKQKDIKKVAASLMKYVDEDALKCCLCEHYKEKLKKINDILKKECYNLNLN